MWFQINDDQVTIYIVAKPHAKRTQCVSVGENALHIALHAQPKEGEANKALILYLSQLFHTPKTHIMLSHGKKSPYKRVQLPLTEAVQNVLQHLHVSHE